MIFSVYKIWIFYDFSGRVSNRHEESYFMSNHTTTSTSLGSRINCTNSNASPVRKSFFQSVSPITTTNILPDGRVERRLETCSYQETEMVRHISSYTVFENHRKSLIQHCLRSNSVLKVKNGWKLKNSNETFWLIFKQCVLIVFYVLIIVS